MMSPAHSGRWVSYLRVSTDRQGRHGQEGPLAVPINSIRKVRRRS
jgi:hypothetical protein